LREGRRYLRLQFGLGEPICVQLILLGGDLRFRQRALRVLLKHLNDVPPKLALGWSAKLAYRCRERGLCERLDEAGIFPWEPTVVAATLHGACVLGLLKHQLHEVLTTHEPVANRLRTLFGVGENVAHVHLLNLCHYAAGRQFLGYLLLPVPRLDDQRQVIGL
jgi:hypothetical protein